MSNWPISFRLRAAPEVLRFSGFELRLQPLALFRDGRRVKLQRQPLMLLALLARRRGALVSHEDIRALLWNGHTVDFAGGTHVCIRQIRCALGDDGLKPAMIENLPREGYRFIPQVIEDTRERPAAVRKGTIIGAIMGAAALAAAFLTWPSNVPLSPGSDAHARGQYLLAKADTESVRRSLDFFRASAAADSSYAPAYLGAANARFALGDYAEAARLARATLARDATSAEAQALLGRIALEHDWHWDDALRRFAAALAIDSSLAPAHQGLATTLAMTGRLDEALQHMARAHQLDPASSLIHADHGWLQLVAGRPGRAAALCREALDLEPDSYNARICLIRALAAVGRPSEAVPQIVAAMTAAQATPSEIAAVVSAPDVAAVTFERWRLMRYESPGRAEPVSPALLANLHAYVGDGDGALDLLERSVNDRVPYAPLVAIDPAFETVADHPRYRRLVTRLGVVPPGRAQSRL